MATEMVGLISWMFPADPNEHLDSDGDGIADGYDDMQISMVTQLKMLRDALISTVMAGLTRQGTDWNPSDPTQWI